LKNVREENALKEVSKLEVFRNIQFDQFQNAYNNQKANASKLEKEKG
jgi:hypothetical protein